MSVANTNAVSGDCVVYNPFAVTDPRERTIAVVSYI